MRWEVSDWKVWEEGSSSISSPVHSCEAKRVKESFFSYPLGYWQSHREVILRVCFMEKNILEEK